MSKTIGKIVALGAAVFIVYAIVKMPAQSADWTKHAGDWLIALVTTIVNGIRAFVDSLLKQ